MSTKLFNQTIFFYLSIISTFKLNFVLHSLNILKYNAQCLKNKSNNSIFQVLEAVRKTLVYKRIFEGSQ